MRPRTRSARAWQSSRQPPAVPLACGPSLACPHRAKATRGKSAESLHCRQDQFLARVPMRAPSPAVQITAAAALTALARAALAVAALAAAGAAGAAPTAEAAVAAQPVQPSAAGMHTFESLALSPDGARIASVEIERSFDSPAALHGPIVVRSTADGHVLERLDPCALCRYAGLTWSPDGRELAFIGSDPVKGEAQLALARGTQLTVLARIQGVAESPR